jgi:glutamyl-tRNA synthetase
VLIDDLVVGEVVRELTDREAQDPDFVIVRSDGQPVFHLVNVIDDLEMGITHVIRGEDHLSNTSKHIALFRAFGVEPPKYAHIPLILNPDGSKMSKRDTGASLTSYMDEGYVPEAVLNFLCLLGWSPKDNREVLLVDEIVERFDLPQILRHNARFDLTKLKWMNAEYIRQMPAERFYELGVHALTRGGIQTGSFPLDYVKAALETCRGKPKVFAELPAMAGFYFREIDTYAPEAALTAFAPANQQGFRQLREALAQLSNFDALSIESCVKATAGALGVKPGALIHPTRLACTGTTAGPSLYHLMEVLGKDRVLDRLDRALVRMA